MDYSMNQKKGKNIGALIGVLVVLLVLGGIGLLFYFKLHNPKAQFDMVIENVFDYLESNLSKERSERVSGNFSLQIEGQSDKLENKQVMEMLNRLNISFDYGVDYRNQLMRFKMNTLYDKKKLLDVDFYSESENGYVYLDGVYDKNIQVALENYADIFKENTSRDDYKVIYDALKKSLVDNLKVEYFSTEFVNIDSKKVKKTTLKLNQKNYQELMKNIGNQLLKNDKFLESLSHVSGKNKTEIKKFLEDMRETSQDMEDVDINLYAKNNQFVQFEVSSEKNRILLKKENATKYGYEITSSDGTSYDGAIQMENIDDGNVMKLLFNDKLNGQSIQVTIRSSIKENGEVSKKDVSNAIRVEEITSEEMQFIYEKILENEGIVMLLQEFSTLSNSLGSSDLARG